MLDDNDFSHQRITIRRSSLLKDSYRQFTRSGFFVNKPLRVIFIGEEAVDEGGPRREYFNLLL